MSQCTAVAHKKMEHKVFTRPLLNGWTNGPPHGITAVRTSECASARVPTQAKKATDWNYFNGYVSCFSSIQSPTFYCFFLFAPFPKQSETQVLYTRFLPKSSAASSLSPFSSLFSSQNPLLRRALGCRGLRTEDCSNWILRTAFYLMMQASLSPLKAKNSKYFCSIYLCSIYFAVLLCSIYLFQSFSLHQDCGGGRHHPVDDVLQNVPENNNNKIKIMRA